MISTTSNETDSQVERETTFEIEMTVPDDFTFNESKYNAEMDLPETAKVEHIVEASVDLSVEFDSSVPNTTIAQIMAHASNVEEDNVTVVQKGARRLGSDFRRLAQQAYDVSIGVDVGNIAEVKGNAGNTSALAAAAALQNVSAPEITVSPTAKVKITTIVVTSQSPGADPIQLPTGESAKQAMAAATGVLTSAMTVQVTCASASGCNPQTSTSASISIDQDSGPNPVENAACPQSVAAVFLSVVLAGFTVPLA